MGRRQGALEDLVNQRNHKGASVPYLPHPPETPMPFPVRSFRNCLLAPSAALSICVAAAKGEMGVDLTAARQMVDILVVDHADAPTAN